MEHGLPAPTSTGKNLEPRPSMTSRWVPPGPEDTNGIDLPPLNGAHGPSVYVSIYLSIHLFTYKHVDTCVYVYMYVCLCTSM